MIPRPQTTSRLRRAIGLAIRRERERRGLTLDQLAARTGVSRSTLARWEARPTVRALEVVAQALRIDPRALLGGS